MRSRSGKTLASSRLMPGGPGFVGQVDEVHLVGDLLGDLFQQVVDQVGVGIDYYDGVLVPARRLLPHLVDHHVQHQRGLAHAGAGQVEVMMARGVIGEVHRAGSPAHGVTHVGAAGDALGRGIQDPRPGAGHRGQLVCGPQGVPQGGQLPHSQHVASPEQARLWRQWQGVGNDWPHLGGLEPGPGGIVVALVGQGRVAQQPLGPALAAVLGEDGDDLELGLVGDAGELILDQQGVLVAAPGAGLPDAPPGPARHGQRRRGADAQEHRLPGLAPLHPQVALDGRKDQHPQGRQLVHVGAGGLGLGVVGGVGRVRLLPAV